MKDSLVSIIFPCRNEAATVGICVASAKSEALKAGFSAEIVVVDNGSSDCSASEAKRAGAQVIHVPKPGYGNALMAGLSVAKGEFLVMADADGTYDCTQIPLIVGLLRQGNDLVVGNRFAGKFERRAMPWANRYIGNPVLSGIGRFLYNTDIRDFHCGLRGIRADAYRRLDLRAEGMEFASEMVIKASFAGMRTAEFPTALRPRARGSCSKLRPCNDAWRHLRLMLGCRFQQPISCGRLGSLPQRSS